MAYKKKYYGLNTLSNFLPNEAKKILKKRGFFEIELLKSWKDIVGENYYNLSKPIKIKKSQVSLRDPATLELKADPTIAFAIQHDQTKLISKINSFFGYKAINRIEIIQQKMANKVSAPNNNNELDDEANINSLDLELLSKYPNLQKNFSKIARKIKKS